jgi:uncharacterized membrane protein YfcA
VETSQLLVLIGGCFVAAFASGMAGFAFNLVAASILFHWLPPATTAPVLVLGSFLIQLGTIRTVIPAIRWAVLRPYVVAGVLGTPFGVAILKYTDARFIVAGVGLLLVVYAAYALMGIALKRRPLEIKAGAGADAAIGFAGGVLGGIGGFSGALPAMWGDLKGLRKDEARAIFQPFIVAMQAVAAIGLVLGGFFGPESARMLLMVLPALVLGAWLGVRAYKVIPAEGFRVVLLGLLLLSGLSLIL